MTKKQKFLISMAALGVVVVAAGGGGAYVYLRGADPMKRADALLLKGDPRAAQLELRNAVRQNPNNAEAHLRLGQTQIMLADPVAAEKELKTARDLGADRWVVLSMLGQVYMAQNRYKEVLAEVPVDGPKPDIVAKNLIMRSMAQVALQDIPAAQASLVDAEKIAPGNAEVLLTESRLALATRDTDLAEKKVNEALASDPKLTDGMLLKGQIMAVRGDKAGALQEVDKAIDIAPNAAAPRLDRANQLIVAGDDKKAQLDVDYVLGLQPRNAGATYLNGVLMVRAGKYADAASELQKLGPVIGRFPRALYFQALAAANLGQAEVAVDFASKYVARIPSDADGVRLLARTQLTAQRPERAVEALTKAVSEGMSDPQTLDLLGRAYAMMGRTPEAIQALKKASQLAPDDAQILTHLASSQMQQGDASNARDTLVKSVQLAPGAPNTAEALVAAALGAGDLDKADEALNALRARNGETESVGILTGMVRLGRLDLDGGRAAFAATLKQFPDSVNAKLNLAKVLILQSRRPEGEALLKEILVKDPANLPALSTLIQLLVTDSQYQSAIEAVEAARKAAPANKSFTAMLADLIVRSGDPRRAVAMLQVMRGNEDLPPVLLGAMARAQAAAGLTDEAKKTYRDILVATPTDMDARRAQVDLLLRNKETDAAKAALADALTASPGNIGVMTAMVQLEGQTNGIDAALKMADDIRKNSANLPNSVVVKGDVLMQAKRYPEAADAFLNEYKLQPTGPLVMRLANALVTAGREDDAYRVLKEWKGANPEDIDAAQLMGLLDVKAKRYSDATANLQLVLSRKPGDTVALNNLAWIYQLNKDPRARSLAQRAYLQSPSPETGDTLGWIMVQSGEAKGAVPLLQQASAQRPADASVKFHLAVALKDTGMKDDAVKLLQPIVASRDDFDEKPAARRLLEELAPPKK